MIKAFNYRHPCSLSWALTGSCKAGSIKDPPGGPGHPRSRQEAHDLSTRTDGAEVPQMGSQRHTDP